MQKTEKALIAMSGGVDSSVAAFLMLEQGYGCSGAMMKLYTENGCRALADSEDARATAARLGIPFSMFDFTQAFTEQVIQRFIGAYQTGSTPNPCVDCNRFVKLQHFLRQAQELELDCIATGHYARIERDGGRWLLKKGIDDDKDQSYVLYTLAQEQLARTRFPLGGLRKSQVREIALERGFVNAEKRDSQDICFVPDGNYAGFIERHTGTVFEKGRFVDARGNDLGEHKGIAHYTVGQRRGLGLASTERVYVREICPESNTVIVGAPLYSKTLTARDINLIAADKLDAPLKAQARTRYRQPEQACMVWQLDADTLRIEFDSPQRAVTRGQAVVLYDGDTVIGGGTIQ